MKKAKVRIVKCPDCRGDGLHENKGGARWLYSDCPKCKGTGKIVKK